jgi:RNA polymerase subunit RPABC4/transcription elongation factor Spt4
MEVGRMSRVVEMNPPICEFCGEFIEDDDQQCPARDDGRCCYP